MTALNTIEYAFPLQTAATGEGTTFTSADITINIPETTSRAFLSCILDIVVHDNEATVVNDITNMNMGVSCDGGTTWTDRNNTTTLVDTGENMAHHFQAEVAAEFTARFSGASDTARYRITLTYASTGQAYLNISAKLIITYSFDETAHSTRIKTVRIPIDSLTARPTAGTATSLGTDCIPALDTFLPEASKTYRAIFAEIWLNTAPGGITDGTLTLDLNTTPTTNSGVIENGSQSPILIRFTWDLLAASMPTDAAQTLRFTPNTTAMGAAVGGWITVTYEYDHANSTTIINSLLLPIGNMSSLINAIGDLDEWEGEFFIEEPDTITLAQSAVVLFIDIVNSGSVTFSVIVGSQSARTYTISQQTGQAGGALVVQRIDSGGAQGAGITLVRGRNTFKVQAYSSGTNAFGAAGGFFILNYTSGKASDGAEHHNKTVVYSLIDTQAAANFLKTVSASISIPEANYWINGLRGYSIVNRDAGYAFRADIEYASGEGPEAGFGVLGCVDNLFATERHASELLYACQHLLNRYPSDVIDLIDIEASHLWRVFTTFNALNSLELALTYHSITFTLSGNVRGYTGDGSGITVDVFRDDTDEKLYTTTTNAGGGYTVTVYDDTLTYYAVARQDDTHLGRSKNGMPATDFHIALQAQVLPMRSPNTLVRM